MSRQLPHRVLFTAAAVLLAGLAVHGIASIGVKNAPMRTTLISDSMAYDRLARDLAENGLPSVGVFHQSPLFPLVLSEIRRNDRSRGVPTGLLLVQALLTSLAIALLVPIGFLGFGSLRAGLLAGLVGLFHGPFAYHSLKMLPVSLALATQMAALLFLVLTLGSRPKKRPAFTCFTAGALAGLAALARAEFVLFILAAVLYLVVRKRPAVAFLAGALLLILPATLHNFRQGDTVLIASAGGENLFIGNQRSADGGHTALSPFAGDVISQQIVAKELAEAEAGKELKPSEVSSYWTRRALSEVIADPVGWLSLLGKKLLLAAEPGDPADMYSLPLERSFCLPGLYLLFLPAGFVLAAGAVGIIASLRSRQAVPLLLFVGFHLAVLLLFFVSTRLRIPLYLGLTLFAGYGLDRLAAGWREPARRFLVVPAACLIVTLTVAGFVRDVPSDRERVRLAAVFSIEGRIDDGLAVLAPALDREPPDPLVLDQAGWLHQKTEDWSGAETLYRRSLAAAEDDYRQVQTRSRLARVLEHQGRMQEAAAEHDRAVASPFVQPGTWRERGMFRNRTGDLAGARQDMVRAEQLQVR
jgi:tetratricopeptide (TPR) repeat protein